MTRSCGTCAWVVLGALVLLTSACSQRPTSPPLVPVASAAEVLEQIRLGKRVVFVDARERQEFEEEHIPGAINLTLREIRAMDPAQLRDADLVIAYCLKDFRGFEVAKALREAGVEHAATLQEQGINGWKKAGLPTYLANVRSAEQSAEALTDCARAPQSCLGGVR